MNEELRVKLFNLFSDHALKMGKEYLDGDYNDFEDLAIDMEKGEYSSLCAKWKRRLIKNKINRTPAPSWEQVKDSFHDETASWRNIPGFYSIQDPVAFTDRSRKLFVLDIPKELGDKILILGFVP